MRSFSLVILVVFSVFAFILGALFVLPVPRRDFVRVEINGAEILAEIAGDPASRAAGLSGRPYLPASAGMLFVFAKEDRYGIWMKGMKFPIDILWIKNGKIADLEENVPPPFSEKTPAAFLPVYKPDVAAEFVLEVKAGFAEKHGIKIGDRARIFFKGAPYFPEERTLLGPRPVSEPEAAALPETAEPAGGEFFIETLRKNLPRGGGLKIGRLMAKTGAYQKFSISYRSGGLLISGTMNVPLGEPPKGGYPVLILNHGLIPPEIYFSGRGSRREQDFFSREGYAVIHPDYRGYASSSPNPAIHHDFYVGYTADVIALVDALKELNSGLLDADRIGMWGHSMGGGIAARVMVLRPEVRAYVLFAPISADVEDNFYELPQEEINWLAETYGLGTEARKTYDKISPLNYFSEAAAPVQLHHGTADDKVPFEFSEKMFSALKFYGKKVEFFKYAGEGHEFGAGWDAAAGRALQFFDKYVKNAR